MTDVDPRKANQYTGFILKGWSGEPAYKTTGDPSWNAPTYGKCEYGSWNFGKWSFGGEYKVDGDYNFGDYAFEDMTGVEWASGTRFRERTRTTASAPRTLTRSPWSTT